MAELILELPGKSGFFGKFRAIRHPARSKLPKTPFFDRFRFAAGFRLV